MAEDGPNGFPAPDPLPNDYKDVPYFFVVDDAFGLRKHTMKPNTLRGLTDEERIFNYRLSEPGGLLKMSYFVYHNAAPPIHRQDHREGMHCSPQLDEDEVSNTAEPAVRLCGECQ